MSYQASFKKELNRLYTIRWIEQNELGKEHVSWTSKLDLRKMVDDTYLPKIYQQAEKIEDIVEPSQDKWVLKPAKGAANRGVYPIIKKNGKLFNCFEKKYMKFTQIKQACKNSDGTKAPYIVEQFIGSDLPYNWEMYCFRGEVGLVRQRENTDRKGKLFKFWDTDFNDIGLIEPSKKDILKPELPEPKRKQELIDAAKHISSKLPYPFVRLDFYEDDKIYLGEITMHPGIGNQFIEEWDRKLGKMWLKAEARMSWK